MNLLADGAGSLQDTSRRGAAMEAAEPCDILSIPNNKFQKILSSLIQKELEDRIRVLSGLPFFDVLFFFKAKL